MKVSRCYFIFVLIVSPKKCSAQRVVIEKKQALKNLCVCRPVTPKARTVMTTVLSTHLELQVNTLQVSVKTSWGASC